MKEFIRNVWRLAIPYFNSEEKWSARGLLLLIVGLTLGHCLHERADQPVE